MIVVRYADDLVVGFEHRKEAERFLKEFEERLAKFGLELHPDKRRLIEFGRYAEAKRKARGEGDPAKFAFLGFTHRCGTDRHNPVAQVGEWLTRVLRGYYNYHGVPGNRASLNRFRERLMGYWWRVLARRSQRGRLKVDRIRQLAARYIPLPHILHP